MFYTTATKNLRQAITISNLHPFFLMPMAFEQKETQFKTATAAVSYSYAGMLLACFVPNLLQKKKKTEVVTTPNKILG